MTPRIFSPTRLHNIEDLKLSVTKMSFIPKGAKSDGHFLLRSCNVLHSLDSYKKQLWLLLCTVHGTFVIVIAVNYVTQIF